MTRAVNLLPIQVRRLLHIGGVKHVDLYAGRNLKPTPKVHPIAVDTHNEAHGDLRRALREIRDHQGKVCGNYELCDHRACRSSYTAWAIADAALKGES